MSKGTDVKNLHGGGSNDVLSVFDAGKTRPLARLTLNRPENFNSFHIGLGEELQAAVRECEDEQVGGLISGAGKHFCAGRCEMDAGQPGERISGRRLMP